MLTIHPYLNFDGDCREAMSFYAQLFGGQLDLQTFGASPMADQVGPDEERPRSCTARLTFRTCC